MANIKRATTFEWLNKTYKQPIFTNNQGIYSTCELRPHRCNVSSWIRDAVIRDRDRYEILGSRDRDFEKRVSRHVSRYPPLPKGSTKILPSIS